MSYRIVQKNQEPQKKEQKEPQISEYNYMEEEFPSFGKKESNPQNAHWSAGPNKKHRVSFEKAAEIVPVVKEMLRQIERLEGSVTTLVAKNEEIHESCIQSLMAQRKLNSEVIEMKSNAIAREEEIDRLRIENEQLRQMVFLWQDWYKAKENLQSQLDLYEE